MKEMNVGIIGTRFMGRAHSNAFLDVEYYFDLPAKPVMQAACGRNEANLKAFCDRFGWKSCDTSWENIVKRDDVDLIDICTSNLTHRDIAVAAAKAGKHVLCEKPLCMNAKEAREMLDAAQDAGVCHMTAFNYRRAPALMLAKKMIDDGKLGKIHHFNAVYYQDFLVDPQFPYIWRHDIKEAGSGAHGDMNAHTVDLARFLVGEFAAITAMQEVFVKERPLADGSRTKPVTVDDAMTFMARFRDGAVGTFQATRFATGRKNYLRLEIFGSEGALIFNLERLNELEYFSRQEKTAEQGFRNILVTESVHPMIDKWWPPGHIIGWEHTFIHEVGDFITAAVKENPVYPDFYDGLRCQQVLDAVSQSAKDGTWMDIPEK